jgi:hypothetical protein
MMPSLVSAVLTPFACIFYSAWPWNSDPPIPTLMEFAGMGTVDEIRLLNPSLDYTILGGLPPVALMAC